MKKYLSGVLWSVFGQIGYLLVALGTNIILARILSPREFGQVAIVMFFIIISKVISESGFSGALIRKENATSEDYSTVFIFNFLIGIFLFVILFFASDLISNYYEDKTLKSILIVSSSVLFINPFHIAHNAKMIRDFQFKKKALYSFFAILISSVIGIVLALRGWGVWAIVSIQIMTATFLALFYWIFEGSFGGLKFNRNSFAEMYSFGINTTLASLLNSIFDNIYQLVLGKYFSYSHTGFFYQAKKLQEVPIGLAEVITSGVFFSRLSKSQKEVKNYRIDFLKISKYFSVGTGLICLLFYVYSEETIRLLLGEEWLGAVFYLKILIIASFFYMQEVLNRISFKVFNVTHKILFLEIFKKGFQTITIFFGVLYLDFEILLFGFLLTSVLSFFFNFYYSSKIIGKVDWSENFQILKIIVIGVTLGFLEDFSSIFIEGFKTFYLIPLIIIVYTLLLYLFKIFNLRDSFIMIKDLKNIIHNY